MTTWGLVGRGLRHHWRGHLAVALGIAVAGSVLVGSLIVGDSVRASLRALVGERLGEVEIAVVASSPGMRAELAQELEEALGAGAIVAPALRMQAVLSRPEDDGSIAGVELIGVTDAYWRALGEPQPDANASTLRPNPRPTMFRSIRSCSPGCIRPAAVSISRAVWPRISTRSSSPSRPLGSIAWRLACLGSMGRQLASRALSFSR